MRKIINFNSFGILSIVSLVSIAGMHSLFNDVLIFYSDPYSQFVYFGAMTLLITILLSLLFSPVLCIITRLPQKAQHFIQLFSIGCILSAYVLLLINLGAYYNLQTFVRIIKPIYNNPLILLAIIAPCFVLVFVFQNSFKEIQQRLLLLGKLFSLFLIFFVPLSIIYNHISHTCVMQQCNTDNNNHLVMIVLDGWPSQYLHHYNPDAPPTVLDPLTEKGLVFNHAYTNYPYTNAYFGFLYSHDPKAGMRRSNYQDNLLSNLQNHNVQAQYIVSHRNAIPEGSAAKVNHYKGLRSYFLTTNTGWLPNILGLDYHTIVAHHMFAYRYIRNNLGQSLYYWLNTDANGEFTGHTLADFAYLIRRNQQKSGQSFTLLHTQWDSLVGNDPNIRPIFEAQDGKTIVKKLDFQRFFDQKAHEDDVVVEPEHIENIRQYDYQYPPEAAVHIQEIHEKAIHNTDVLTQQLNQLFTLINQENQHPPTILLTADHGSIYGKGRVW